MPTICRLLPYCFCSATNSGISSRHGGHQVAQKFTKITFPLQFARDKGAPEISRSGREGAISGFFTKRITGALLSQGAPRGSGAGSALTLNFSIEVCSLPEAIRLSGPRVA